MKLRHSIINLALFLIASMSAVAGPVSLDAHYELLLNQARNESLDATQRILLYDSIDKLGKNIIPPEIFREKALLWRKVRNINKEVECFQSAINVTPKDSISLLCRLYTNTMGAELRAKQWDALFKDALSLYKLKKTDSLKYYDIITDIIISDAFLRLDNLEKATIYVNKARHKLEKLPHDWISKKNYDDTEISLLFNEGNIALSLKDYPTALKCYKKAKTMAYDEETRQLADANITLILQSQGEFNLELSSAEDILLKYKGHPNGPTAALNLFEILIGMKDTKAARKLLSDYADEFVLLDSITKEGLFEVTLTELNQLEGNYKEALDHLIVAYETLERETIQARNKYSSTFDADIIKWEQEQAEDNKINWLTISILLIIILIILSLSGTFLYIRLMKRYRSIESAFNDCETQRILFEKNRQITMKEAENTIEERTRDLSKITMNLAIVNELIEDIQRTSASRQLTDKDAMNHIRRSLKEFRSHNDIWNLFKGYFEKLNQDFFNRLYRIHPDLSNSEIRMCAFIQMGLTTKEISIMTSRSPRTVNCIKYNLRKKCGITTSTEEYLRRIAAMEDDQISKVQ